jgi:sugar phosphate isomerase/epimerase
MKLGLHSSIFPENLNVLQKIEYTQNAGYDAIELETGPVWQSSTVPPRNVVARFLDKKTRTEIMEHAKSHNVKICSLCFGMYMTPYFHLADPDPRYRDLIVSQLRDTIDLAVDFQSGVILVFVPETAPMRLNLNDDQKRSLLKDSVLKLDRFAKDAGVIIGLEPSAPTFFRAWRDIKLVLDDIGSENIACYYDIGNALGAGLQPDEEMLNLGKYVTQIHVKEGRRSIEGKIVPPFPSLGQGTMDWDKIFDALKKMDYQRYLIVEHFPDPNDPYRMAVESRVFIEKYLK